MKALALLVFLLVVHGASAVYPGDPLFRGCAMLVDDVPFDDVDCDKVPDVYDNCPLVSNLDQVDRDKNGPGDACDLIVDQIRTEPERPMQGRSVVVTPAVLNNRAYPMRNMVVKVEVPRLGLSVSENLQTLNPGDWKRPELLLKIPDCAPTKLTDFVVIVEYPIAPGQLETFSGAVKVPVVSSGLCAQETGSDKTIVTILETQDVDPVEGALYPFTIENKQFESKAYILSTSGLEGWGQAQIQPGSVLVVPPGQSREGAIQVWAYEGGKHSFTFTVHARDDTKQIILLADVPKVVRPPTPGLQLLLGMLVFVTVLVLIGLVLVFARHKHKQSLKDKLHPELKKTAKKKVKKK